MKKFKNEDRYFGSDLNKFIHEFCSKEMIAMNIDLIQIKWAKKRLRIIESKHTKEAIKDQQLRTLSFLAKILSSTNQQFKDWTFEVLIVKGDQPYNEITVHSCMNGAEFTIIGQENVINFLNFEL